MTPSGEGVPGYASPALTNQAGTWCVVAQPWNEAVGTVTEHDAGWTAHTPRGAYAGLWPDRRAAAEALLRQAGYEVLP
jgi:hypothetical protein